MARDFGFDRQGLSLSELEHIDKVCLDFEHAWRSGGHPQVEAYLGGEAEAPRRLLLMELLLLDLDYRCREGQQPVPEDYMGRLPGGEQAIRDAFELHARSACPAEQTRPAPSASPGDSQQAALAGLVAGQTVGRYEIRQRLGRGGFGEVYLAWDKELHRNVAVKIPRPGRFRSPEDCRRFVEEAATIAQLKHRGIVPVHDIGRQADGTPFLIMEYVPGRTLEELLDKGRLSPRRVAQLTLRIAEAIHYAHRRGIIHRDLKPTNVILDASNRPFITDFGLAERWEPADRRAACTRVRLAGTAPFIPPEVYRVQADLAPAIDVYALGVIMYRALTGRYPFVGDSWEDVRGAVLEGAPPLPKDLDPEIPEPLQRICLKAMERHPENRYETAEKMAGELRRFLRGRQVLARPTRYDAELQGRLQNHCTEIRAWREENLVSVVEMDRLLRPYWFMMGEDTPLMWLSKLFPWETVVIRLGGWLLLLSSLLWLGVYWSELGPWSRVMSVGLPTVVLNVVGWLFYYWRSKWNARIFMGIGALLLPLCLVVVLCENHWLRFYQSETHELFAREAHEEGLSFITPTNFQLTVAAAVFVGYCLLLVRESLARLFVIWLGIGIVLLATGLLLRSGLKVWLEHEHVARALSWYLVLALALGAASVFWGLRGNRSQPAVLYAFFPAPTALLLTLLAWHGSKEWLNQFDSQSPWKTEAINIWWMLNGAVYWLGAAMSLRTPIGFVRFWSGFLSVLVPVSLLVPSNIMFHEGFEVLARLGDRPLTAYQLICGTAAVALIVWGTVTSRATLTVPGLVGLTVFVFRIANGHFEDQLLWPFSLAVCGAVGMGAGVLSALARARLQPPAADGQPADPTARLSSTTGPP